MYLNAPEMCKSYTTYYMHDLLYSVPIACVIHNIGDYIILHVVCDGAWDDG